MLGYLTASWSVVCIGWDTGAGDSQQWERPPTASVALLRIVPDPSCEYTTKTLPPSVLLSNLLTLAPLTLTPL
jgi:hypothetical protein